MIREEAVRFAEGWAAAWNAHALDRIPDLHFEVLGGDVGRVDAVAFVVDRRGQRRQQRGPIAGIDLDNSRSCGCAVGDGNVRRDVERSAARAMRLR